MDTDVVDTPETPETPVETEQKEAETPLEVAAALEEARKEPAEEPAAASEPVEDVEEPPEVSTDVAETPTETPNFSWDDWDGNEDAVPEAAKPIVEAVKARYDDMITSLHESIGLYRLALSGDGDLPELIEARKQLEALQKEVEETKTSKNSHLTEVEALRKALEEAKAESLRVAQAYESAAEAEEKAQWTQWAEKNRSILDKPENKPVVLELLRDAEVDWGPDHILKMVSLTSKERARIRNLILQENVPLKYAIDLAAPAAPQQESKPFPPELMVGGRAAEPARSPDDGRMKTLDDHLDNALSRALSYKGRR